MSTAESISSSRIPTVRPWLGSLASVVVIGLCAAFTNSSVAGSGALSSVSGDPRLGAEGNCGACEDDSENGVHIAVEYITPQTGWGEGDGWHGDWKDGDCLGMHGLCTTGQTDQASADEVINEIVRATADRDAVALAVLARMPSVRINSSRASLQVVGCDGKTIVGHVPLDSGLLDAVEVAASEQSD